VSTKLPEGYTTPTTTDHAYRFGFMAGRGGYARVSHADFMSAQIVEHLYPYSLYRAYRRGFAAGREHRNARLAVSDEVDESGKRDE
jgi:hypothetical protein